MFKVKHRNNNIYLQFTMFQKITNISNVNKLYSYTKGNKENQ